MLSWLSVGYILFFLAADFRLLSPGVLIWKSSWFQIFLFAAFWFALDLIPSLGNKSLPWWMYAGFFTYVSHAMLLDSLEKLLYRFAGPNPLAALLDYIFMPWIVEALLLLTAWLMIRYIPGIWKLLTGGRVPPLKTCREE